MANKKLSAGLWPVMITPFQDDNRVDYEGLKKLTEFYIRNGVNGLFANCESSEMYQLTNEERLKVIETVVKVASPYKIPVVAAGTFEKDIEKCSDFVNRVYDAGVEAVIALTNYFAASEEGDGLLKKNIEQLMNATGSTPLGFYEVPHPYKRLLSPELVHWMGTTERFYFFKDTSCDPIAIKNKIDAAKGSNLYIYNANTSTLLNSFEDGARGMTPIAANFYPELYSYFYTEYVKNGATSDLAGLNDKLTVMNAVVDLYYPFSAKYFLQMRGLPISTRCRTPYGNPQREHFIAYKALMTTFKDTAAQYGVKVDSLQLA